MLRIKKAKKLFTAGNSRILETKDIAHNNHLEENH